MRYFAGFVYFQRTEHNPSLVTFFLYDPQFCQPIYQNLGAIVLRELNKDRVEIYSSTPPQPTNIDIFSAQLEKVIRLKGINISSSGWSFFNSVKANPPFLNIQSLKIFNNGERELFSYLNAQATVRNIRDSVRGGDANYYVHDGDTWESVSKEIYGSEKFSDALRAANYSIVKSPFITPANIPYIDITNTSGLSSDDLNRIFAIVNDKRMLETVTKLLALEYHLQKDEVLPLFEIVYDATQLTLNHESAEEVCKHLYETRMKRHEEIVSTLISSLITELQPVRVDAAQADAGKPEKPKQAGRYRLTHDEIKRRKKIVKDAERIFRESNPRKTWKQIAYELEIPERTLRDWRHNPQY